MKELDMNNSSEINWAMVDALTDETMDRSELPPLDESFFARATWRTPRAPTQTVVVTVHVPSDVLAWFKTQGDEYKQRMVAALRIYAEAHEV